MEKTVITYEVLYDALRMEKQRTELQKLDQEFYKNIKRYIEEKKDILQSQEGKDSVFTNIEVQKTRKEIENIQKILKELYERREAKIIELALIATKSNHTNSADKESMLKEEKTFYEEALYLLANYRDNVLSSILSGKEVITKEEPKDLKDENMPPTTTKQLKFISSVPTFVGTDLNVYGPFEREDSAEIPLDADNIFVYANLTIPLDAHYQDLYIFHITAESQDDVQAPTGLTLTVSVEEILEFALSPIGNITLLPGEANVQNITIAFNNSGNDRERFDFSVELSDEDWEWELSQERVWLEPDSEHKIYLYLFSPDNSIFSDECVFDIFMEHSTGTLTTGFSAEVLQIFNLTMEVVDIADYATHSDPSVLNISVRNYGNGQDNISISLTGTKAGWTIDFSSDYLIIPRKGIRYFTVTITPQKLAHYNDDFPFTVKVHSQGGFSLESENLEVKVSKLVLLDLECDNKNITLSTKKNTVQVTVQLLNKGNVEDYYQMNVVMPPDVKMSLEGINKDNITIPAFNDIFMVMLFEFPDDITAGLYYIDIDISSSRQSDITLEMRLNITIPNIYELQVDFSSDKDGLDLSKSSSIKYTITVNNTSNRNITVILEDIGELKGFKITIQPKELTHKLDISEGGEFTILISSTPSSEIKNIDLSLKVRVLENGKTYSEDETLKVTRSIITNGDDDDDDSDSGEGKGGLMSSWIIWAVAGAILLFIICLVVVLVIKKGKKKDEELLLDDEIDDPGSSEEATETEEVEVAEVEIAPDTLEIKENDDTLHEDFASEENNMVKASDDEIIDQKENISGKEVSIPKPKPPKPPE